MDRYKTPSPAGKPKVRIVISACINDNPQRTEATFCCIHSFLAQTYQNFDIVIAHDGRLKDNHLVNRIINLSDKITFLNDLPKVGIAGFQHRYPAAIRAPLCDWVLWTNEDNYYCPEFLKIMLHEATTNNADFVYCNMVHSYLRWNILDTQPVQNLIDMGAFMTRMDLVQQTPWEYFGDAADGVYVNKLMEKAKPHKVHSLLFTHN